jgi:hypothetical protein
VELFAAVALVLSGAVPFDEPCAAAPAVSGNAAEPCGADCADAHSGVAQTNNAEAIARTIGAPDPKEIRCIFIVELQSLLTAFADILFASRLFF